jgi:hypothetical protein
MLSEPESLRQIFEEAVTHCFSAYTPVDDPRLTGYVAGVLTEFTATEHLYPLRDAEGRPMRHLGDMLIAADPVHGRAASFDEERKVRKHIGDFALFSTGMYPESTHKYAEDATFAELVRTGKESYYIVSQFDLFEYADEAALFAKLAELFETCRLGLTKVRDELTRRGTPGLLM